VIVFVLENYLNTIKFSSSWHLKISRKTGYVGQKFTTRGAKVYTVRKLNNAFVYPIYVRMYLYKNSYGNLIVISF